jgi:hypothetical protein
VGVAERAEQPLFGAGELREPRFDALELRATVSPVRFRRRAAAAREFGPGGA